VTQVVEDDWVVLLAQVPELGVLKRVVEGGANVVVQHMPTDIGGPRRDSPRQNCRTCPDPDHTHPRETTNPETPPASHSRNHYGLRRKTLSLRKLEL
jgi:hypothetical protein